MAVMVVVCFVSIWQNACGFRCSFPFATTVMRFTQLIETALCAIFCVQFEFVTVNCEFARLFCAAAHKEPGLVVEPYRMATL